MAQRAVEEFRKKLEALRTHTAVRPHLRGDKLATGQMKTEVLGELIRLDEGYYFLIACASLTRTSLKGAMKEPDTQLVTPALRKAHAIAERLPTRVSFSASVDKAVALRERDLVRKKGGGTEGLFRDRLAAEGIPIAMSPPLRRVPGLLVAQRKPDGVYPDPDTKLPPRIYLEIKKVRRVADDIQKRLYEIAEVSLEMKLLYGDLRLEGFSLTSLDDVSGNAELRSRLRVRIAASPPVVVALLLCPQAEAEKYREGGQAFIDRIFFQEEIDECIGFLRDAVGQANE